MTPKLVRTTSTDPDFQLLVKELDRQLAIMDGDEHAFYAQLNKTDLIRHVIVAYDGDVPVGCGAVRQFEAGTMEVKRMFVPDQFRRRGIASVVLRELEAWCTELGYERCILETGRKQPEALALYHRSNYRIIPNYGKYAGVENSVCFEKKLVS